MAQPAAPPLGVPDASGGPAVSPRGAARTRHGLLKASAAALGLAVSAPAAWAEEVPSAQPTDLRAVVAEQEQRLRAQGEELSRAEAALAAQAALIADARRELEVLLKGASAPSPPPDGRQSARAGRMDIDALLKAEPPGALAGVRATGAPVSPDVTVASNAVNAPLTDTDQSAQNNVSVTAPPEAATVGEAPPPKTIDASVLPMAVNTLTTPGHFILETDASYVETNNNLLVFEGIELTPGVEIGAITANTTDRNLSVITQSLRYGVAPRWEVQVAVPYVYGVDRVTTAAQRDQQVTETSNLHGAGLGDVQVTARYQVTRGLNGWPILVANLMVKPPTGTGPFDLKYDQFGAARTLPTGSGFWGVEPSLTMLYTSDPAVIFANLGYLYNAPTNINKTIGGALVSKVDPGGAVDASFGFAFALNQRFSFSLGYQESYFEDTYETLNGTRQRSYALNIGELLFGTSFRVTDRTTVSANFQFGVTSDAPNVTATLRVPFYF